MTRYPNDPRAAGRPVRTSSYMNGPGSQETGDLPETPGPQSSTSGRVVVVLFLMVAALGLLAFLVLSGDEGANELGSEEAPGLPLEEVAVVESDDPEVDQPDGPSTVVRGDRATVGEDVLEWSSVSEPCVLVDGLITGKVTLTLPEGVERLDAITTVDVVVDGELVPVGHQVLFFGALPAFSPWEADVGINAQMVKLSDADLLAVSCTIRSTIVQSIAY